MKTIRMAFLLGASMLVIGSAAQAADAVVPSRQVVDWSGFYTGLHGGWGWADAESEYGDDEFQPRGLRPTWARLSVRWLRRGP